jgi:putative ATPase
VAAARRCAPPRTAGTILFIDEVHRFNKAQQDAFLPHVEDGTVVFIGATTENPSFELNNALLSRARVYLLKPLGQAELEQVIEARAGRRSAARRRWPDADAEARALLPLAADGDARRALNLLELAGDLADGGGSGGRRDRARPCSTAGLRRFDKGGDAFYDQISALHKSMRGSARTRRCTGWRG